MADRKYYCFCDSGCKFETMSKEQILAAITQAVNGGGIGDVDTGFVTTIKTIDGTPLKFFVGTQNKYELLTDEEKQNLYAIITNDKTVETIEGLADELHKFMDDLATGAITVRFANTASNAGTCSNANYASTANRANNADNANYASTANRANNADKATAADALTSFDNAWLKYDGGNITEGVYLVRTYTSEAKGPIYATALLDTGNVQDRCASGVMQSSEIPLRVLATYAGNNVYTLELQRCMSAWGGYPEREYDFEYKRIHAYAVG